MITPILYKLRIKKYFFTYVKITVIFLVLAAVLIGLSLKINLKFDNQFFEDIKPSEEVTVSHNFNAELFYNKVAGSRVFSPQLVAAINGAKKTIDVAIYSIDMPEVIQALGEQANKGIIVTVIIPNKKEQEYKKVFSNIKINLITLRDYMKTDESSDGFIHHKFILIDVNTTQKRLFFGSTNFTLLQEKYDAGYFIQTGDDEVIAAYDKEFNLLKQGIFGIEKLKDPTYRPFTKKVNYLNGFMEIWFGPGFKENSIKYRIIDLIRVAEKDIKVIAWVFNDQQIAAEIIRQAEAGVKITIISDDSYVWSKGSQIKNFHEYNKKSNNKIELISDSFDNVNMLKKYYNSDQTLSFGFNPYLHHHALIVDDKVLLTGTNNWSRAGFYFNDEDTIVTDIDFLVNSFKEIFAFLYQKNKNKNLFFELNSLGEPNLKLKGDINLNSKVIFYRESAVQTRGIICYEGKIDKHNLVTFPKKCLSNMTVVYLTDERYNLLAGNYLFSL